MIDEHGMMDVKVDGKPVRLRVDSLVSARPVASLPAFPLLMRPVLEEGEIFVQSLSGPGEIFKIQNM